MNGKQATVVALVFLVSVIALAFAFGAVFDDYALGIGPAIAVAAGIAVAAWIAVRKRA